MVELAALLMAVGIMLIVHALRARQADHAHPWLGYFSADDERDGGHSER